MTASEPIQPSDVAAAGKIPALRMFVKPASFRVLRVNGAAGSSQGSFGSALARLDEGMLHGGVNHIVILQGGAQLARELELSAGDVARLRSGESIEKALGSDITLRLQPVES